MADAGVQKPLMFRAWPKMIFLWPSALLALFMGFATWMWPGSQDFWGGLFIIVFGVNLLVLTFDFPRATSLTVLVVAVAVVLGLLLLNQRFDIIPPIKRFFASREIHASREFYFFMFLVDMALFIGMYVVTRFDYWEMTANELIHHHGLLGDVERISTAGLKLNKEISDVFEYMLAGAGRMIILVPSSPRPIILENVLTIAAIERRANQILNARTVRIEAPTALAQQAEQGLVTQLDESESA